MQQLKRSQSYTGSVLVSILALILWVTGCEKHAPDSAVDNEPATTGSTQISERQIDTAAYRSSAVSELTDFISAEDATPAAEECCTNVGKMDDCWWEDAIADGVTCQDDGDCAWAVAGACVKEGANNLGVCRCNPGVAAHCNDPGENRFGICITDPENPSGLSLCGPSYCNGYLKCSCFGGCEWWDQSDTENTPQRVAEAQSSASGEEIVCCEGDYPWGGIDVGGTKKIITFYGVGSCDPAASVECVSDAECDDGNPCTSNTCDTASNVCEIVAAADGTVCGVDTDTTDCTTPYGCVNGFCQASVQPVVAGSSCDIDTSAYDATCWRGFCGVVTNSTWYPQFLGGNDGICHEVKEPSTLGNDVCAGATTVGDMGSFSNTDETTLTPVSASTDCAVNSSYAAAPNCDDPSGNPLGENGNDLIYSFEYTTTSSAQQQLYGFVITVESDFHAVVYTETDTCTDGAVDGHSCQYQPQLNAGGSPVPWEYEADNQGLDWNGNDQRCDMGYSWCSRGGGWTYPEDVTINKFSNGSPSYVVGSTAAFVAQTFVYPISDESATSHRVYIHVDGASAADFGDFTLTVERRAWDNSRCERVNDAPRVYDITDVSVDRVYRGTLAGAANSDHSSATETCGGYDCAPAVTWGGKTSVHGVGTANEFWPNAAYFKIQPDVNTDYCITADHTSMSGMIDAVLEVRRLNTTPSDNEKDLCQGDYSAVVGGDAALGEDGLGFTALAGETYLVLISEAAYRNTPCTTNCNYRMVVTEGNCSVPCEMTQTDGSTLDVVWGGGSWDDSFWMNSPGIILYKDEHNGFQLTSQFTYNFNEETNVAAMVSATENLGFWPELQILVDGVEVFRQQITNEYYSDSNQNYQIYSQSMTPITGTRTVEARLVQDSVTPPVPPETEYAHNEDANVYLNYILFGKGDCPSWAGGSVDTDTSTDTDSAADTDSATATDSATDSATSGSCVPAACSSAPVVSGFTIEGGYNGCIFVTDNVNLIENNWSWTNPEYILINSTPVPLGAYWDRDTPSWLAPICNGGWYVELYLTTPWAHVEVR